MINNLFIEKENLRIGARLLNVPSIIKMRKYEQEYFDHKKLMRLRSKIKVGTLLQYKIYDISFKGFCSDPDEEFRIYERSTKREIIKGTIYEIRKNIIKGKKENLKLKVVGRASGNILIKDQEMVPIFCKGSIVGTVIVEII